MVVFSKIDSIRKIQYGRPNKKLKHDFSEISVMHYVMQASATCNRQRLRLNYKQEKQVRTEEELAK